MHTVAAVYSGLGHMQCHCVYLNAESIAIRLANFFAVVEECHRLSGARRSESCRHSIESCLHIERTRQLIIRSVKSIPRIRLGAVRFFRPIMSDLNHNTIIMTVIEALFSVLFIDIPVSRACVCVYARAYSCVCLQFTYGGRH